jgi:WD40 repeat protein
MVNLIQQGSDSRIFKKAVQALRCSLFAGFVLAASMLHAVPREWTSTDGKFKVVAELQSFDGRIAKLKKADGTIIEVPHEKFSPADAEFLETRSVEPRATLTGHKDRLCCLALSLDGLLLASGGGNSDAKKTGGSSELILWNPASKTRIAALPSQGECVRALAFSPDSKLLVAGYDRREPRVLGRTVMWSMPGRKLLRTIEFAALSVAFSPDGKLLALGGWEMKQLPGLTVSGSTGAIKIWNVSEGREIASLQEPVPMGARAIMPSQVEALAFSSDGKTLAAGSADGKIRLWDVPGAALQTSIPVGGAGTHIKALTLSPDGGKLAFASQGQRFGQPLDQITLWDVRTSAAVGTIDARRLVNTLSYSHDGRILAVGVGFGTDVGLLFFDPVGGGLMATLRGHKAAVNSMAFSRDDKTFVSASSDNTVKLWDVPPWVQGKP